MKTASMIAIALGVGLLALSALWTALRPGTSAWTEDKADRWTEIKARLHNLAPQVNTPGQRVSMHGGDEYALLKEEFDKLKVEHDALQLEFEGAALRPDRIASILKWSGVAVAIAGVLAWYAANQSR